MRTAYQLTRSICLALFVGMVLTAPLSAQGEPARFILKLNDNLISSFKDFGSLRSALPQNVRDSIDTIELRFAGSENETPLTMNVEVTIKGENAEINVTDAMLDSIRKQPVRIPLNGKTFGVVFLRYQSNATETEVPDEIDMGEGPNRFIMKITDESTIAGSVVDMTAIELMTNFGKVELTLDQIAGVRFKSDGKDNAIVFLNNGDSITGTPTLGVINVQTFWGLAEINAANLRSMSASPSATYTQESTDFGTRWKLRTGNALAPGN